MKLTRRTFFKVNAVAATATLASVASADAASPVVIPHAARAVLVDLTKCIGCRTCEAACAQANGLPEPDASDNGSYAQPRLTSDRQSTVVNRYNTSRGEVFVKTQCMHCVQPACAAGCPTKALSRLETGAVVWDGNRCMGCRFCMIACPFDVPKFEYNSWNPRIQKCQLCTDRLSAGQLPACVENCPGAALTFGPRHELLEQARQLIYQTPKTYVSHVYGEHEVGGTSWLYIAPVPFKELGFRTDLSLAPVPEATRDFLTAVPIVLVAWPALLAALYRATAHGESPSAASLPHPSPALAAAGEK